MQLIDSLMKFISMINVKMGVLVNLNRKISNIKIIVMNIITITKISFNPCLLVGLMKSLSVTKVATI